MNSIIVWTSDLCISKPTGLKISLWNEKWAFCYVRNVLEEFISFMMRWECCTESETICKYKQFIAAITIVHISIISFQSKYFSMNHVGILFGFICSQSFVAGKVRPNKSACMCGSFHWNNFNEVGPNNVQAIQMEIK